MTNVFKTLLFCFFIFTSSALSEVIKFGSAVYEGEVKNGKAHGLGTFTFEDGTKYEGKFSKNRFHGKGKYTDPEGNVFKGKFKYGKITKKIDRKTREVIKLSTVVGKSKHLEVRGSGGLANKWFEAELKEVNTSEIKSVDELDIFDLPSIFSADYGDEKKLKEILDTKNAKIEAENTNSMNVGASTNQSIKTVIVLTDKGQRDQEQASQQVASAEPDTGQKNTTSGATSSSSSSSSGDSGGGDSGGGIC